MKTALYSAGTGKKILKGFTLIELLMVSVIFMTLMTILMPALKKARARAKFVRWYACNKTWSRDPACVINYDFQEITNKNGVDYLLSTADGGGGDDFNREHYDGKLMSVTNGEDHSFDEGLVSAGRWGSFKKALHFNGSDTYIDVKGTKALDFGPTNDFTILISSRFDSFNLGDGLFSKSLWGSSFDTSCQYDMYCDDNDAGTFDVDIFDECVGWDQDSIEFNEDTGWIHTVFRYKYEEGEPLRDRTSIFINGVKLEGARDTNNDVSEDWQTCSSAEKHFMLGAIGSQPWRDGGVIYNFEGYIDEFIMIGRALSDGECKGMYEMGKE